MVFWLLPPLSHCELRKETPVCTKLLLTMPRGCVIIGVCMAFFVGVVFLFGLHKGNEDLTGGGVMYIIIGLLGLYGLFGSK